MENITQETIQNSPYASYLEDLCAEVFENEPLAIGACLLMADGTTLCCYHNAGWMDKLMMMGAIQTDAMMDAIKGNRDVIEEAWAEEDDEELDDEQEEDGELDDG